MVASLFVVVAAPACAGVDSRPLEPSTTTPSPTAGGTIPVLRLGDDGVETALEVGGTASVMLPASYEWTDPVLVGDAVTISQDISDVGSGSRSWTVTARRPGTATVTLTGSPTCRSETPSCAAPDLAWKAGFAVS